ncbi:MAG: BatA and WFA domain-containing protein [Phycisphaerae bacterium]|nr:BatA and WFA domain-containing protein [Phycisphaerae bacterium]
MPSIFKNPWMLAAVFAVAIPLIIEWLFRRRKRQVELPTLRFLLNNKEQEKIRRQDRILLILRCLGIFALVMALARPIIQRGWIGGQKRNIVILLDATASMNQQVGVESAFHSATRKAANLIRKLPRDNSATVTVATVGVDAREVVVPTKNLDAAANQVEELRPTYGAAPISDGLEWVRKQIEAQKWEQSELYVFSDFQKQTWQPKERAERVGIGLGDVRSRCETFLVDVGGEPAFNFVLKDLQPDTTVITASMPVTFSVTLDAIGKVPADKPALVRFSVDGVNMATQQITLTGEQTIQFKHLFPVAGEYLVEVSVSGDDFSADNERLYLCSVPDSYRVLILDDRAGTDQADSRFLAKAIAPAIRAGMPRVSHFSANVVPPGQVAYENVDSYAAIVLTATGQLTEPVIRKIERRVRDGGGLLIFCGPNVNVYDYNRLMFNTVPRLSMLPCKLIGPAGGADMDPAPSPTAPGTQPDQPIPQFNLSQHPALTHLYGIASDKDAGVSQCMAIEKPLAGSNVMLKLSTGVPLMVEKPLGDGKVILCTTTAGDEWSYLPAVQEYSVMIQEILTYLVGNPDRGVNLEVNDPFVQPVYVSSQKIAFRCPDDSTVEVEPYVVGRLTTTQPASTRPDSGDAADPANAVEYRVRFDQTALRGKYEVVERIQEVVPRRRFVVNQGSTEADLSRLNESEFKQAYSLSNMRWVDRDQAVEDLAADLHTVIELAVAFFVGLLALLAGESYLAWRFGRRRSEAISDVLPETAAGVAGGTADRKPEAGR